MSPLPVSLKSRPITKGENNASFTRFIALSGKTGIQRSLLPICASFGRSFLPRLGPSNFAEAFAGYGWKASLIVSDRMTRPASQLRLSCAAGFKRSGRHARSTA
jgi:hypothetical protein